MADFKITGDPVKDTLLAGAVTSVAGIATGFLATKGLIDQTNIVATTGAVATFLAIVLTMAWRFFQTKAQKNAHADEVMTALATGQVSEKTIQAAVAAPQVSEEKITAALNQAETIKAKSQ